MPVITPLEVETIATFKSTRLINGHSIETRTPGVLEFVISHRFGRVNTGFDELFGLDNSNIRFALEFGLAKNLNIGLGRSSFSKVYDGFVKYKFLAQTDRKPVTITGFVSAALDTQDFPDNGIPYKSVHRYAYTYQALIARKFNSKFSAQLMPTLIHRNLVPTNKDANDLLAIGMGAMY